MEREWDCKTWQGVIPEGFLFLSEFTLFHTPGFGFAPKASLWLCPYLCKIHTPYPRSNPQALYPDLQQWNNFYGTRTSGIDNLCISPLFSSLPILSPFQGEILLLILHFNLLKVLLNFILINPKVFTRKREVEGVREEIKRTPRCPAKHEFCVITILIIFFVHLYYNDSHVKESREEKGKFVLSLSRLWLMKGRQRAGI